MNIGHMQARTADSHGSGYFGAPRGGRPHNGVDMACDPGTPIDSPVKGTVTKIGYCYNDDLDFRYVQVTAKNYDFRIFYVDPDVTVGQDVDVGAVLGQSQRLGERYPGITEHVHFEIKHRGEYVDPTPVILALANV